MPLFGSSRSQQFTPKQVKLSDLYKFSSSSKTAPNTVLNAARQGLKNAGFSDLEISKIVTNDAKIPVQRMKEVVSELNKCKVFGFDKQDPDIFVKNYLNKERVKAQNIARIRKEHMLEARDEDLGTSSSLNNLGKGSATSLNNQGVSPNLGKTEVKPMSSPPRINLKF